MNLYFILGLDTDLDEEEDVSEEQIKEILKDRCIVYLSCNGTFNTSEWKNLKEWEQQIIYEASILVKQENAAMIGMASQNEEIAARFNSNFDSTPYLQLLCDRHARQAMSNLLDPRSRSA